MSQLEEILTKCLEGWNTVEAYLEMTKPEHEEWIAENGADKLVPIIIAQLTEENWQQCPQVLRGCQDLLCHIAKVGKPKEVIIFLAEHCESFQDDYKFRHVLPAIGDSFSKWGINTASAKTLEWTLGILVSHIQVLPIPEVPVLEGKERLTIDNDPQVVDLCQILEVLVDLFRQLSELPKSEDEASKNWNGHLVLACIQILAKPIAYLYLDYGTTSRQISEHLVLIIKNLVANPVLLASSINTTKHFEISNTKFKESEFDYGFEVRWSRGVGILFYLIFDIPENRSFVPSCYEPLFLFNMLLGNLNLMMVDDENYLLHLKSISLAKHLNSGITKQSVNGDILDIGSHTEYLKSLFKAMVFHSCKDVRALAFKNFELYFGIFTTKGRYRLTKMILDVSNHSGIMGHTIGLLKNTIVDGINQNNLDEIYKGRSLQALVHQFCKLKHGEQTDLLEVSDEIMSSLQFLFCILCRDKNNETEIRDMVNQLERTYLEQVKKGLELSRSHYNLRLRDLNDPNRDLSSDVETTVTIGGRVIPIADSDQMKNVISSALNTFDLIEVTLIRLTEAIEKSRH